MRKLALILGSLAVVASVSAKEVLATPAQNTEPTATKAAVTNEDVINYLKTASPESKEAIYKASRDSYGGWKGTDMGQRLEFFKNSIDSNTDSEIDFVTYANLESQNWKAGFEYLKEWNYYKESRIGTATLPSGGDFTYNKGRLESTGQDFSMWIQHKGINLGGGLVYSPKLNFDPNDNGDELSYTNNLTFGKFSSAIAVTYAKNDEPAITENTQQNTYYVAPTEYVGLDGKAIGYDFGNNFYANYNITTKKSVDGALNLERKHGMEIGLGQYTVGTFTIKPDYSTVFSKHVRNSANKLTGSYLNGGAREEHTNALGDNKVHVGLTQPINAKFDHAVDLTYRMFEGGENTAGDGSNAFPFENREYTNATVKYAVNYEFAPGIKPNIYLEYANEVETGNKIEKYDDGQYKYPTIGDVTTNSIKLGVSLTYNFTPDFSVTTEASVKEGNQEKENVTGELADRNIEEFWGKLAWNYKF